VSYLVVDNGDGGQSDRVTQASGMVSVQASCTLPEALVLMETRAQETGRSIEEIANEVVEREIRFD
jgi:AmiR/NasT family two-component response regulator